MNTDTNTLTITSIIILGVSSGFFAGFISAIVNLIIAHFNHKNVRTVEAEKYQHSINDYRYKELHEYLKNVCDIPNKVYVTQSKDEMIKLVEASNNEDEKIMSIYRRALPLLDKSVQESLDDERKGIKDIADGLVNQLYESKESSYSVRDLIIKRDDFKIMLIEALQKQLADLLAHSKNSV